MRTLTHLIFPELKALARLLVIGIRHHDRREREEHVVFLLDVPAQQRDVAPAGVKHVPRMRRSLLVPIQQLRDLTNQGATRLVLGEDLFDDAGMHAHVAPGQAGNETVLLFPMMTAIDESLAEGHERAQELRGHRLRPLRAVNRLFERGKHFKNDPMLGDEFFHRVRVHSSTVAADVLCRIPVPGGNGPQPRRTVTTMSKVCSMREAISQFVPDGSAIVMGCALESGIPFAAGHELVRQGRRDLTLIGPISDMLFDLLIGSGCVRRVIAAWVGNVGDGLGHNFRRAVEHGIPHALEVHDHSNLTLALSLQAAAWGVPYLPTLTALGSDLLRDHPHLLPIRDPFSDQPLVAVRAVQPDVAIVHVQRADGDGNAHLWGNLGITSAAVHAARRVIVSCEELVPAEVIRSDPNRTVIPGFLVSAVVHEPWGGHPSPLQGYSRRDDVFFVDYHEHSRTRETFLTWLRRWVLDVPDRAGYLARVGEARLRALTPENRQIAAAAEYAW